jgi:hypothetical protein
MANTGGETGADKGLDDETYAQLLAFEEFNSTDKGIDAALKEQALSLL